MKMEERGIDRLVAFPLRHPDPGKVHSFNELAVKVSRLDRVCSGVFFTPALKREAERTIEMSAEPGVRAVTTSSAFWGEADYDPESWVPGHQEMMEKVLEKAGREGLVVQLQTGVEEGDARKVFRLIDSYPEPSYQLAHMGGSRKGHMTVLPRLIERLESHDIYVDTSLSEGFAVQWFTRELKRRNALDRMLFASGEPWGDTGSELKKIQGLELEDEEKNEMLYGNAEKLYL